MQGLRPAVSAMAADVSCGLAAHTDTHGCDNGTPGPPDSDKSTV